MALSKSSLLALLTANLPDNSNKQINAKKLRDTLTEIINSDYNLIDNYDLTRLSEHTLKSYRVGECAVVSGIIYQANVQTTPSSFVPSEWTDISVSLGSVLSDYLQKTNGLEFDNGKLKQTIPTDGSLIGLTSGVYSIEGASSNFGLNQDYPVAGKATLKVWSGSTLGNTIQEFILDSNPSIEYKRNISGDWKEIKTDFTDYTFSSGLTENNGSVQLGGTINTVVLSPENSSSVFHVNGPLLRASGGLESTGGSNVFNVDSNGIEMNVGSSFVMSGLDELQFKTNQFVLVTDATTGEVKKINSNLFSGTTATEVENGLSLSGDKAVLGGSLTGDTIIEGGSGEYTLGIDSVKKFEAKALFGASMKVEDTINGMYAEMKTGDSKLELSSSANDRVVLAYNLNKLKLGVNGTILEDAGGSSLTLDDEITIEDVSGNKLVIDHATTYTDANNGTGIEYAADYSSGFTSRSLVDKAYVDANSGGGGGVANVTGATNGLNIQSKNVGLGGALTEDTNIDADQNEFNIEDCSEFKLTRKSGADDLQSIETSNFSLKLRAEDTSANSDSQLTLSPYSPSELFNLYGRKTGDYIVGIVGEGDNTNPELKFNISTSNSSNFRISATKEGFKYNSNFNSSGPAAHGDRWITDKGYVDNAIANAVPSATTFTNANNQSGTYTWNVAANPKLRLTQTGDLAITITNQVNGGEYILDLYNDSTDGHVLSFTNTMKVGNASNGAIDQSSLANANDLHTIIYNGIDFKINTGLYYN